MVAAVRNADMQRRADYLRCTPLVVADFGKVAARYLTTEERALSSHHDFLAATWCAKEALYKYYRRGGLNLLSDIRIAAVDFGRGEIREIVRGEEIALRMSYHEGDIVVSVG